MFSKIINHAKRIQLSILIILVVSTTSTFAKTITSANQGGLWQETTTWIGGVVPTQTDDVIINSVVTTGNVSYSSRTLKMNNLTINSGGKILREVDATGKYNLEIYGNLVNNGAIIDYTNYFDVYLYGNLENQGILKPRTIDMKGENQHITTTKAIECSTLNLQMEDNELIANSNLLFKNCYIPANGTKQLHMGSYSINLSADSITFNSYGKVVSASVLSIPLTFEESGIVILDKAIIGGEISGNLTIESPTYAFIKDVIVNGNLTIADGTKISSYGDLQKLDVRGDFANYGELNSDTIRLSNLEIPPIRMNLSVHGNVASSGNTGITKVTVYTDGESRSMVGDYAGAVTLEQSEESDSPGGKVIIESEVNISGKLEVYADLEIEKGATLNLLYKEYTPLYVKANSGNIVNHGNMASYNYMNDNWSYRKYEDQPWTSVDFDLRDWEGRIDGVDVEVHNGETYPGLPGSVKRWWRLASVGEGKPTQIILKLYYDDSILNGQKEENLQVFRSTDKGKNWEVVSVGDYAVLDTVENSISIGTWSDANSMLDEFGDFVISSGDGTVPIPSNIIVNVVGSPNIRLGAPNRFTIHLYNAGTTRTESFYAGIALTDEIAFKQFEIPTNEGVEIVPIDSIGTQEDRAELFFVPYLEPSEEYSFDAIVVGVSKGTKSVSTAPSLTAVGLLNSAVEGEREDYIAKKVNEVFELDDKEAEEYARGQGITVKQLEMVKKKDGRGVWAAKTVIKYGVEQASKAHPLTNLIFKIGNKIEQVAKVKDSVRRRIWHWLYKETGLYGVDEVKVVSGKSVQGKIVTSWDPNEKIGPTGYGDSNYLASTDKMNYTIRFENKKEATAPAYRIQIIDTLSVVFNPESVNFGTTSHSSSQYNWKMERDGNILKWDIEGIELPPNVNPPEGEGYVSFSVDLVEGLESGANIENRATIIFDINDPITTNTWINVLDKIGPTTVMNPIHFSAGDTLVNVSWSSVDNENGSGIGSSEIFASVNNGPFKSLGKTFENNFQYRVSDTTQNNYRFYVLADDNVNNFEKSVPEIAELNTFLVSAKTIDDLTPNITVYPNPTAGSLNIGFLTERQKTVVEIKLYSITGKLIKTEKIGSFSTGQHHVNLDLSYLREGVYFAEVMLNESSKSFKFIKK